MQALDRPPRHLGPPNGISATPEPNECQQVCVSAANATPTSEQAGLQHMWQGGEGAERWSVPGGLRGSWSWGAERCPYLSPKFPQGGDRHSVLSELTAGSGSDSEGKQC